MHQYGYAIGKNLWAGGCAGAPLLISSGTQHVEMDSFFICPESPGDISAIFDVHCQAFAQDGEARLVNALREDGDYNPDLSFVAVHNDRIVGHILFCPITIVSERATIPATALAPLAVHQDYQCRGIGAALVQEGLEECRRLGQRIVIVVGHPGYYPRFGFSPALS